ncbi:pantetheine-phosphate adenylyltransferase family protein [Paracoccidioides lutzii Pb01]|uniref:Pantetheine-phosphate adenylyltransferase family protein n=1 Tax=Paracoccidioides lutzii (strain ATCC MYA-826 / Pb01) TaxID=502779 RepID=C1GYQ4_PARBA|nr:pantetheine-phosphate adenylyltransferase family protein [Paracoccidioides lutzii Pb01]EEH41645.1 pantetheine-phosphate adenylyltransferase family protein [Paracoccidioides lutzii Pb01]
MAIGNNSRYHEALLLLPGTPSTSFSSLKAAYGPALSTVLADLSRPIRGTNGTAVLDIGITIRGLAAPDSAPRGRAFAHLQHLLASFYRLLGVISAGQSVELDGPGGVDARVFFIDDENNDTTGENETNDEGCTEISRPRMGPIIRLADFTVSGRSWRVVFSLGTVEGDLLLDAFTLTLNQQGQPNTAPIIRKLAGLTGLKPPHVVLEEPELHPCRHYSVAVGGTFDHLHAGHKLLLTATALAVDAAPPRSSKPTQRTIIVGITGDELLVNKKYADFLESWDERWRGVWAFLESIIDFARPLGDQATNTSAGNHIEHVNHPGPNGKYVRVRVSPDLDIKFVRISDTFGPTITDEDISALVVSKETRSGGKAVNDEREKKGWSKLEIFEVDVLDIDDDERKGESGENFESKISSTEIRRRQMNLAKGNL